MPSLTARPLARPAALLVAAVTVALTGLLAAPAQGAPAEDGWLRVGHLSPGTPEAQVRLTPFAGGATDVVGDAAYGDLSAYQRVPAGLYTLSLVPASDPDAAPMLSRDIEVAPGEARTVVATGKGSDVSATVLDDDLSAPPAGQAKIRVLSAATTTDAVTASVADGPVLTDDLARGAATGYTDVAARAWDISLSGADRATTTSEVTVAPGATYTLLALDGTGDALRLEAVQDAAASTGPGGMPRGGVDAGGGGLAPQGDHLAGFLLAGSAACALVGVASLARRRRTA